MTNGEVIDACGRVPSGSEVVVRLQAAVFVVTAVALEYVGGVWRVVCEIDTGERVS